MTKRKNSKLWTFIIRLTLVLGGIIFALFTLELAIRISPISLYSGGVYMNFSKNYVCAPSVGWLGKPNHKGVNSSSEYTLSFHLNSKGMYDTEHALEKEDGVFRILIMGDSFTQAMQVDEPLTAHQQLEDMLNERLGSPDHLYEVVNTGVSSWGTAQELVYYQEQGQLYQPDLVLLLFFIGNDVENNIPGHANSINDFNCFAPYFPLCDGELDLEPWYYVPGIDPAWGSCSSTRKLVTSGISFFQQNSHLFAHLEPLLISYKPRRMYGKEFGFPLAALYRPEQSEEEKYGWEVTEALLTQFNSEVKANGSDFAVALIGPQQVVWLSQFTESQLQAFNESDPLLVDTDMTKPNRHITAFLQSQNIPMLDLQQPMIDFTAATGAELYLQLDGHWTAEGNRVAAQFMTEWLINSELVSK